MRIHSWKIRVFKFGDGTKVERTEMWVVVARGRTVRKKKRAKGKKQIPYSTKKGVFNFTTESEETFVGQRRRVNSNEKEEKREEGKRETPMTSKQGEKKKKGTSSHWERNRPRRNWGFRPQKNSHNLRKREGYQDRPRKKKTKKGGRIFHTGLGQGRKAVFASSPLWKRRKTRKTMERGVRPEGGKKKNRLESPDKRRGRPNLDQRNHKRS